MNLGKESTSKRVVLAGATGLVGSYCLRFLQDSPDIQEIIVLTRRSLNETHPKLKEHIIDFSKLDQDSFSNMTLGLKSEVREGRDGVSTSPLVPQGTHPALKGEVSPCSISI